MRYLLFVLICLICAISGFALKAALENDAILAALRAYGPVVAAVFVAGLALLGLGLTLGYVYARHRLRKLLKAEVPLSEAQIAEGLVDLVTTPDGVTNPTPADRQRAALVNAGTWLMRREASQFYFSVVVTVMGGLIGTATLFLLYEQNLKIEVQNAKIQEQNEKITLQTDASIVQSVLLEGARRASFASELTALQIDIRAAVAKGGEICPGREGFRLRQPGCWTKDPSEPDAQYVLLKDLERRISSFLKRNTPYRVAVGKTVGLSFDKPLRDQFDFPNLSPERGRMLEILVRNRIVIFPNLDFSYSDLRATDLSHSNLVGLKLQGADLSLAKLQRANLAGANLNSAKLTLADLESADVRSATFEKADLSQTSLISADLRNSVLAESNLFAARLDGASLNSANLSFANLMWADFLGVNLDAGVLTTVNLSGSRFDQLESFNGVFFEGAWAWSDDPPTGVWNEIDIDMCVFDPEKHDRAVKPDECWPD